MEEIYTTLKEAIAMLGAKRDDHQNAIQRQKIKMPSKTYDQWIHRVIKTEEEVKKLLARYDKQSESSQTICFLPRSNFSNEMKKKGEKVIKLLEDSNQLGSILVDQPLEPVIKLIAPNIKKFSTLQMPLEETLDLLKKDKVKGIAIFGMMGTGKTAIMKNLNNHEEVAKRFDMVMWIKVSAGESNENLDMSQLQKAIAKRLKVDMEGSDSDDIAERTSNELNGKRYLLLLDNVKADLDIHQMGIPPCENGSKIVLTTRESHIRFPRVDRVVKVTYLSPKESFRMFQDVANCPKLKDDREAEACAWKIIRECGGHPLLINIIASVFQKKDLKLWSEGFKSLKRFSEKGQHELKELRNVIKFCHDDLEDTQRKCLLYGVLYPEEIPIYIDCLLECWEAEDFLGNGGDSRKAYINGIHILNSLKGKSLLEEDKSRKYVMMHKCIRQVLLYILSDDPNYKLLVQQTPPDAKCWSEKIWISLIENKFDKLPDCPNCGSLSTLFLQENLALKSIPASFFEQMTSLKVLDLCHTGIELLPSSLSQFRKLEHLEVLDIRGSGFNNIPSYIGNLNGLRHFRVSFAKCKGENDTTEVEFNCNVISKLSKLEELVIDVKSPRHKSNKVVVNIIKNVVTLKKLTKLQFCFLDEVVDVIEVETPTTDLRINVPEANILYTFIEETRSWRNIRHIRSFQFFIDCPDSKYPCIPKFYEYKRYVRYCNGEGYHPIFEVLANVDAFDLVNKKDIKQLSDLRIPSMKEVHGCQIESCSALETVVDTVILPNVKHLYMKNLPKLQNIWNDRVDLASLTKLKTLVLSSCQMLRIIFPLVVIQHIREIECLKIEDCPEIVEV
ncbi:Disease resistance protein RPS2, partial [Camellia lanceoleosa]